MTERLAFLHGSQHIVGMTEKATECLHLPGEEHRIVGISSDTARPRGPRNGKPAADECLHQRQDHVLSSWPTWRRWMRLKGAIGLYVRCEQWVALQRSSKRHHVKGHDL